MAAHIQPQGTFLSRPSSSHQPNQHSNETKKQAFTIDDARYEDPSFVSLPFNDSNSWYYPTNGYDTNADGDDVRYNTASGNWGMKNKRDSRWMRKGKIAAWGPGIEEWEAEERARKRIKLLIPLEDTDDSPVTLPHLRSPSPPTVAPYPPPDATHLSYTSFVLDKAVTYGFRSPTLDEMEEDTNSLIEGETLLRRALGRLWQLMSEDPDMKYDGDVIPKREDQAEEDMDDDETHQRRRAPDLTPTVYKLFLESPPDLETPSYGPSQPTHPEMALENLEKAIATLREIQDDGREYVERLGDIREAIGSARSQRNGVWDLVREKALKELQDAAHAATL